MAKLSENVCLEFLKMANRHSKVLTVHAEIVYLKPILWHNLKFKVQITFAHHDLQVKIKILILIFFVAFHAPPIAVAKCEHSTLYVPSRVLQ